MLLAEAAAIVRERARARGITIRLQDDARGAVVSCDRDRVIQILTNLLDNAVKFSPEGALVVLAARAEQGGVHVSVSDNGPGMDTDQLAHAFDRLWQASPAGAAGARARLEHRARSGAGPRGAHLGRERPRPGQHLPVHTARRLGTRGPRRRRFDVP